MYDDWRGRLYPDREPKRRWFELYAQASADRDVDGEVVFAVAAAGAGDRPVLLSALILRDACE
jgi:hypothetical protein